MSVEFIFRLLGMIGFAIGGAYLGRQLGEVSNIGSTAGTLAVDQYAFLFGLLGGVIGLLITPYLTTRPVSALRKSLGRAPAQTLFTSLLGLIVGLVVAALLAFPLSLLPDPFGKIMPFAGVVLFGYLGISVFIMRQEDILSILSTIRGGGQSHGKEGSNSAGWADSRSILLDTSVIIDGRIADISRTGFLPGSLADSALCLE